MYPDKFQLTFEDYETGSGITELEIASPAEGSEKVVYNALALAGEAGEIAGKLSKVLRDNGGVIPDAVRLDLLKESGDVLWHLTRLIVALDGDFESVAEDNLAKLRSRKARGVLGGSGDNR